jgi:hypothetical protein
MKQQDPKSRELMLQLTKELVDQDLERIVEERLQERYSKQKQSGTALGTAIPNLNRQFKSENPINE